MDFDPDLQVDPKFFSDSLSYKQSTWTPQFALNNNVLFWYQMVIL